MTSMPVSEARFRRLAENAQDIIFRYRLVPVPGYEYVSPSVTAITGYTPEEHYADPELAYKVMHPDDIIWLGQNIKATDTPTLTTCWTRKDGQAVWIELRGAMVYDQDGIAVAVEGIARDITEHQRAVDALRASEAALKRSQAIASHRPLDVGRFDQSRDVVGRDQAHFRHRSRYNR